MKILISITVKTNFEGFHFWRDAPIEVDFLKKPHRHIFYVEVKLPVAHDNRQLEFFMVKHFLNDTIAELYPTWELGERSCEMMCKEIGAKITEKYGIQRGFSVTVSEDNENGSTVDWV